MPPKKEEEEVTVKVTAEKSIRPGYKTTEFWLASISTLISLLLASGVIATGSPWERVASLALAALATMGYSASRGSSKKGAK